MTCCAVRMSQRFPRLIVILATALVLGVLRWQIDLDHRIRIFLKHPNAKVDIEVLIALRLGAFQLLHMDRIPVHAAIDESVELAKQAGHHFASGMVNAVLRKVAASRPQQEAEDWRRGFPDWMVARWRATYGEDAAVAICRHGQSEPKLTVRVDGPATREELASAGIELEPGQTLTNAFSVASGNITASAAFREGRVRPQDEGSQLVAELVPRGETILDCCAAPGGKTLILAERNPGARIVACESSPQRLARLQERLEVLGDQVECRLADVAALENRQSTTPCWPTCLAAARAPWAAIRRSATGWRSKSLPARHYASARFFALLCAPPDRADL